jgi:methylenetetrahydrofolate dehydrogenase (NADP+)/methenyltetrahydrofolate cyclohydrolase
MIIDGKALAEEILEKLKEERKRYQKIKVASFLIGKDEENLPASPSLAWQAGFSFLKVKKAFAEKLDIDFRIYEPAENLGRKKLRKYIHQIIKSPLVKGAIIQLPLPPREPRGEAGGHIPEKYPTQYFLNSIPENKDIDCLSSKLLGKFFTNSSIIRPPVVEVVDFLKNKFNLDFQGKIVLVVGYGRLVGKPIAHYLANEKATVIIAQEYSNLNDYFKIADIIISGVGKSNLINDCKKGSVLIDFGYSKENGRIFGDINFERLKDKASLITPTPNGTGPILVAKLFENLFKLMEKK